MNKLNNIIKEVAEIRTKQTNGNRNTKEKY